MNQNVLITLMLSVLLIMSIFVVGKLLGYGNTFIAYEGMLSESGFNLDENDDEEGYDDEEDYNDEEGDYDDEGDNDEGDNDAEMEPFEIDRYDMLFKVNLSKTKINAGLTHRDLYYLVDNIKDKNELNAIKRLITHKYRGEISSEKIKDAKIKITKEFNRLRIARSDEPFSVNNHKTISNNISPLSVGHIDSSINSSNNISPFSVGHIDSSINSSSINSSNSPVKAYDTTNTTHGTV